MGTDGVALWAGRNVLPSRPFHAHPRGHASLRSTFTLRKIRLEMLDQQRGGALDEGRIVIEVGLPL